MPPRPEWTPGWQLGKPDLVLSLSRPYVLPAEGRDVYRNFVLPVPLARTRYVQAVELRPGNPKIVHHAFIELDSTRQSRRLDGRDGQPGFANMITPASVQMPAGQLLSWQPGRLPTVAPPGLAWTLPQASDLVLQFHMRPSGKPEVIQPQVGLYFTDQPPTNTCYALSLTSFTIDIPPGDTNDVVQDQFTLPVEVAALAVLPHAHYLCREMQGYALLPDGTKRWLIWIRNWDFNWQGEYQYAEPVRLPKGATLCMRYTYDNSTNNFRNPNNPPKRVTYGPQTTDEMAELWFQLLPDSRADLEKLEQAYSAKLRKSLVAHDEYLLRQDPNNASANMRLGILLLTEGRVQAGVEHLRAAIRSNPRDDQPHYYLGLVFRQQHRYALAQAEFETALRLNPANGSAHGNLGVIFAEEGKLALAESHLRAALRINPDDPIARELLDELLHAERGLAGNRSP